VGTAQKVVKTTALVFQVLSALSGDGKKSKKEKVKQD
jgi:hypothetical protein